MLFKKSILGTFLPFFAVFCHAQPQAELARMQQKYADQSIVFTNINERVNIEFAEGKFDINLNIHKESIMLDDRAGLYAGASVEYSDFMNLKELKASTFYPNDKHYKQIKVEKFFDKDVISNTVFSDDVREKKFSYPQLVKGAKRVMDATYQLREPHILSSYIMQEYAPVEKTTLTVICPPNVEIGYKIYNDDSVKVSYETYKEKNKIVHQWKTENLKPFKHEGGSPDWLYYVPHIVYYIKNYTTNGKKERLTENVDDLHAYYSKLVKGVNDEHSDILQTLVDSLIDGKTTNEEKTKAIYYWVKDNIKYIAFESGYEGFIPDQAKNIYEKRFGDCKGMASIITTMLRYANIPSYLVWIGTRKLPYTYEENPTTSADNHMIAAVKENGNYVYLDGTSTPTPYGYPSSFIQGKEAIIHLSDDKYELAKIPEVADSLSENRDSVFIEIGKDMKLIGKGYAILTGYERDYVLNMLDDISNEEKTTKLKQYYEKGNNKFVLNHFQLSNEKNRDLPLQIQYDFNLSDYVVQSDDELFVNMNLEKHYAKSTIDKDRNLDYEFSHKHCLHNAVTLKIPSGYHVEYLPKNDAFSNDLLAYDIRYSQTKNTVTMHIDIHAKCLMLKKKDFQTWNETLALLKKNYAESVTFKKNNSK